MFNQSLMHADTILKKYSSTVATIFTGIASAALFGHTLTVNFMLGISIVFISMHQVIAIFISLPFLFTDYFVNVLKVTFLLSSSPHLQKSKMRHPMDH